MTPSMFPKNVSFRLSTIPEETDPTQPQTSSHRPPRKHHTTPQTKSNSSWQHPSPSEASTNGTDSKPGFTAFEFSELWRYSRRGMRNDWYRIVGALEDMEQFINNEALRAVRFLKNKSDDQFIAKKISSVVLKWHSRHVELRNLYWEVRREYEALCEECEKYLRQE